MPILALQEALQRGYRPDADIRENAPYMQHIHNCRATEQGLQALTPIFNPFTSVKYTDVSPNIVPAGGFPQMIRGKAVTLLCTADKIYSTSEAWGTDSGTNPSWALAAIPTYRWSTYDYSDDTATAVTITAGGRWHFMDFQTTWLLFNGMCIVFKLPFSDKVFVVDEVSIGTGCVLKDTRPFFAGFDPSDTWDLVDWPAHLNTFYSHAPDSVKALMSEAGLGQNWVWYGGMTGDDLLWLFTDKIMKYHTLGTPQGYTDEYPYYLDLWKRNESGAIPLPSRGKVKRLQEMADGVVAFSEDGVIAMVPFREPIAHMGLRDIAGLPSGTGITGQAVAGSANNTVFVDQSGCMWHIKVDMTAERLGYKEWFAPLLGEELHMLYDEHNEEYYIGNYNSSYPTYLLSRTGLTSLSSMPTSVHFVQGGIVSPVTVNEPIEGGAFVTIPFTGESPRQVEELRQIHVLGRGLGDVYVRVRYQINLDGDWKFSDWILTDDRGVATMSLQCTRFRIEMDWDYSSTMLVSGVQVVLADDRVIEMKDMFRV